MISNQITRQRDLPPSHVLQRGDLIHEFSGLIHLFDKVLCLYSVRHDQLRFGQIAIPRMQALIVIAVTIGIPGVSDKLLNFIGAVKSTG